MSKMPLKKYNTASILMPPISTIQQVTLIPASSASGVQQHVNVPLSPKSPSASPSPPPPLQQQQPQPSHLPDSTKSKSARISSGLNSSSMLNGSHTSSSSSPSSNSTNNTPILSANTSSSSPSSSSSSTSNHTNVNSNTITPSLSSSTIANHMSSLNELLPSIIESAATSVSASSGSASATVSNGTPVTILSSNNNNNNNFNTFLPNDIKSRLYTIFNQIEREFDLLYAENIRLQQQLLMGSKSINNSPSHPNLGAQINKQQSPNSTHTNNNSSTSTLVASSNMNVNNLSNTSNTNSNNNNNNINNNSQSQTTSSSNNSSPKSPLSNCLSAPTTATAPSTTNITNGVSQVASFSSNSNLNMLNSVSANNHQPPTLPPPLQIQQQPTPNYQHQLSNQTTTNTNHQSQSTSQQQQQQQSSSLTSSAVNAITTTSLSAKSAILSSKNRINNLSFPKFRPNAKEFIMQSIKNTSAQITNANKHSGFNSKLLCSLSGHKDGIWDINCIPIPNHLLNNSNYTSFGTSSFNVNYNLLVGTASADSTARLWYLSSLSSSQQQQQQQQYQSAQSQQLSPQQNQTFQFSNGAATQLSSNSSTSANQQVVTTGFCIQQYCGHSGSINSIRFHPRFFTDATNLILTASGDCQAHIWQCVLSPVNDSLESTSDVVLNYSNCYSFATSNYYQTINQQQHATNGSTQPASSSVVSSPPPTGGSFHYPPNSSSIQSPANNSHYHDLISNTATIRSPIKRFEGHTDVCIAAEWFPDGELLATASWDRSANVYNVETGKILCSLQHDDYLTNISIHRINKIILTSSKDTTFKVWDFRDPICSVNVYQGHSRSVNSAIFVNDDKIATSSDDQTIKLWDLRIMRSPIYTISVNSGVNRICTINPTSADGYNSTGGGSGETYLCLPLDNRDIKIYNLQGERVLRLPRTNRVGHRRLVTSLSSYGNLLLSASFDKQINCWSFDQNPPKSSSSKFSSQINKENNAHLNEHNTNITSSSSQIQSHNEPNTPAIVSSSSANKNLESRLFSSASSSPPPSASIITNTSQGQPSSQQQSFYFSSGLTSPSPSSNFMHFNYHNSSSSSGSQQNQVAHHNQQQQQQQQQAIPPPLTHITNNSSSSTSNSSSSNSKGINTLSKLAERIKI